MIKKNNPRFLTTPTFRQQYLGEWCDDPDARCYRFDETINRTDTLPGELIDYNWLIGVDVGFKPDPMGFVVCAYKKDFTDRCLYVVHAHKQGEMLIDEIASYIEECKQRWPITQFVIDGANSNVFAELTRRMNIPFDGAKKQGKSEFIGLVTDDLMSHRIKLVGSGADDLANEWMKLVWDRTNPSRPMPDSACEDHLSDAFLYAWRYAYHYLKPAPLAEALPARNTNEWMMGYQQRLAARLSQPEDPIRSLEEEFGHRHGSRIDIDDLLGR
jgi:hypothetical protein